MTAATAVQLKIMEENFQTASALEKPVKISLYKDRVIPIANILWEYIFSFTHSLYFCYTHKYSICCIIILSISLQMLLLPYFTIFAFQESTYIYLKLFFVVQNILICYYFSLLWRVQMDNSYQYTFKKSETWLNIQISILLIIPQLELFIWYRLFLCNSRILML